MKFYIISALLLILSVTLLSANNNLFNADLMEGEEYLAFCEEMPAPVGGIKEIYKNVEYPKVAQQAGVQGKVYILAFVNEQGGVDDVKVVKGIGGGCDEAAMAAVKKAKFTPGKSKGKPVKVKYSLPVTFKLK